MFDLRKHEEYGKKENARIGVRAFYTGINPRSDILSVYPRKRYLATQAIFLMGVHHVHTL